MAILNTNPIVTLTAGETIAAREYVFVAHATAPHTFIDGIIPGRVYLANGSLRHKSVNAVLIGFAIHAATVGQSVQVQTSGRMSGFTGLVAGAAYQPSTTPGAITRLENHRAAPPNPIARAISTTELEIVSQQWEVRGKAQFCVSAFSNNLSFNNGTVAASTALTASRTNPGASSQALKTYFAGGSGPSNVQDAITFSTELMADVGDLTVARQAADSGSSATKIYTGGGTTGSVSNVLDQIAFATEGNSTDVGDLTVARSGLGAGSSALRYLAAGGTTGSASNVVDRMLFASEGNLSDLGDLSSTRSGVSLASSLIGAYIAGGDAPSNVIDKLTTATDVIAALGAVLSTARGYTAAASSSMRMFVAGGSTGSASAIVNSLNFSDEVVGVSTSLISAQTNLGGASS
jgi:hypothetical protein